MQQKTMGSHSQRGFRLSSLAPALFGALSLGLALGVQAQTVPTPNATNPASLPDAPTPQPPPRDDVTVRNVPRNFLEDQAIIWTSPARIRTHDLKWIIPLGVATGVALATDHYVLTNVVSTNPSFNSANINASNAMIYSLVAAPVALYGFGRIEGDDHARETGILTAESMVDGVVVEQVLKLALWQERPYQDTARGRFFQSIAGIDSSFPSSHTLIAFSAASAIAAEYPSRPVQWLVYTGATGVGLTRVLGRDHFPADVLVGGALGWLIGHSVVKHRHHHDLKAEITGHDGH
jgi:membrane-associated phospholipid phosphatase